MHWILKCLIAGLTGGATAVVGILTPMLMSAQRTPTWWPDLTVLFIMSGIVTGGAYWLKGPQITQAQP